MIHFLQRLTRKVVALALLASVGFLAYALVIEPLLSRFSSVREQIAQQRQYLRGLTSAASQAAQARVIDKRPAVNSGSAIYLPGSSDAVQIAELQSLLGRITEVESVAIRSTRALAPRERDGVRLLGIEAQLNVSIGQLQRILHKLENGRPYLVVESMQITPPALLSEDNPTAGIILDVRLGLLGIAAKKKGRADAG